MIPLFLIALFVFPQNKITAFAPRKTIRDSKIQFHHFERRFFSSYLERKRRRIALYEASYNSDIDLDKFICEQMTIKVCSSTSCAKKRKILGMDEFATFGGMYERAGSTGVSVEESTCLGKCKMAPCVAVEHEDYIGNIGLEGMTDSELSSSTFLR